LIVQAIAARQDRLGLDELALMDIDGQRLELVNAVSEARIQRLNGAWPRFLVNRTTDARQALDGADFVITTFRVGGIESRIVDERVPLGMGVLGQETTGPGGFAMGLRTIPVILDYARQMKELCPQAWLVNFANPAGMLAEAIYRSGWQRVVGICDAPSSMQRVAAALAGAPPEDVYLDYFGLNHLGWVRSVLHRGRDLLPQFLGLIEQMGGLPGLPFDPAFVSALGMIPNEYLFYYYSARRAVENILQAGPTRGERIAASNLRLYSELFRLKEAGDPDGMLAAYHAYLDERGSTYMQAETGSSMHDLPGLDTHIATALAEAFAGEGYAGVALDMIEALLGGPGASRVMIVNLPNQGAVHGMEAEDVVEIPALVSRDLLRPLAVGGVPAKCLGLMQQVKAYEQLTIRAAVEGSYALAHQALTLHPLVSDDTLARRILDGYIAGHGSLFPTLH
jgi:6-phospho-beta-glucosidase